MPGAEAGGRERWFLPSRSAQSGRRQAASSHCRIIRSPRGGVHPTQPGAMLRADKPQAARSDRRSAGQGGGRVPR